MSLNSYGAPTGKPCGACHRAPDETTPDGMGIDPCLGCIPGVSQACCGHGRTDWKGPYVVIGGEPGQTCIGREEGIDYTVLRGMDALKWFAERGKGPLA